MHPTTNGAFGRTVRKPSNPMKPSTLYTVYYNYFGQRISELLAISAVSREQACAAARGTSYSRHDDPVLKTLSLHTTCHCPARAAVSSCTKTAQQQKSLYTSERRRTDGAMHALKPVVGQRCPEHALRRPHSAALNFVPEFVARARVSCSFDAGN